MEKIQELLKSSKILFIGFVIVLIGGLFMTYSNHFHNGFYFDDFHTIVHNSYIHDLSNIPKFFKDNTYMSTNVGNRSYRPVVATLNAIDYSIDGLNPFWFHVSIFSSYLLLIGIMYFFLLNIFNRSWKNSWNIYFALFGTAFFAFHTVNAETINYIIARSDSFSTLCIVSSLLLYQIPQTRKTFLYLIPFIIGLFTKQVGVVGVPLLFMYIYLFEEKLNIKDTFLLRNNSGLFRVIKKIAPILFLGLLLFMINQLVLTKGISANLLKEMRASRWDYFTTQWYVIARYIGNFILPINLSADPDVKIIGEFFDVRKFFGLALIVALLVIAIKTSLKEKYRPISFGILWFFIALFPTSTFHPLGQISNDHRTFLPNIGLVIAVTWSISLIILHHKEFIMKTLFYRAAILFLVMTVLLGHAYGTYQRNIVWSSSESLWKDVASKSPNNGRGLMNYGLTLMAKGKYEETKVYFDRALELMPYYSYLHINMGILRNAMGFPEESEKYYKNALLFDRYNAEAYYYYGAWLNEKNRKTEAIAMLEKGYEISPGHIRMKNFLTKLKSNEIQNPQDSKALIEKLHKNPTAEDYINLSLAQYKLGQYEACIESCLLALEMKPNNAEAYNNICSSYIKLKQPEKAIKACENAIKIKPDFTRAKNNLNWAKSLSNPQ